MLREFVIEQATLLLFIFRLSERLPTPEFHQGTVGARAGATPLCGPSFQLEHF
jgi:hypothetical protein